MDVALISTLPATSINLGGTAQTTTPRGGFSVAMAAESGGERATLEQAEALVGTRIRAPEGGCGCDAFVDAVVPETTAPTTTSESVVARSASPVVAASARSTPVPGQILAFADASVNTTDLDEHLHRAIVRNATEMIMANTEGLVEVMAIPWDRATLTTSAHGSLT